MGDGEVDDVQGQVRSTITRRSLLGGMAGAAALATVPSVASATPRGVVAELLDGAIPATVSAVTGVAAAAHTGARPLLDGTAVALSTTRRLTAPVSAVALELPPGVERAWIRANGPGGRTGWTSLPLMGDGPDEAPLRRVTELAWVRAADELEVAVPEGVALADVDVHLSDTLGLTAAAEQGGSAAVASLLEGLLAPVAATVSATPGVVGGLLGALLGGGDTTDDGAISSRRPAVVRRSEWGASAPRSSHRTARPRAVVLHHTVTRNDYRKRESPAIVRAIQHHHQRTMGWSDVGYNLLVDRYGNIFEGRAGGIEAGVVGAHAAGYNTGTVGVSVLGNYETARPTRSGLDGSATVLAWQARVHGIDLREGARARVGNRSIPTFLGHRDVGSTACPGRNLVARMPEIRRLARGAR